MQDVLDVEFVNRDQELQRLRDMRAGRRKERILLIRGPAGVGKSWVLRRAQQEHHGLPNTILDLALQFGQDPVELVRGLRGQLTGVDWSSADRILVQADSGFAFDFQGYSPVKLRELITRHFTLDDLRTLCYDLEVDFDDLEGVGKSGKARELMVKMSRRPDGVVKLVEALQRERPAIPLADVRATNAEGAISFFGTDDGDTKDLQLVRLAEATVDALGVLEPDKPALVMLDTYDRSTKVVRDWLLEYLFPKIREGVLTSILVVIAGEVIPELDREWRLVASATELSGLPMAAIREYWVVRRMQPETDLAFAMRYSRGMPFMLAQMADMADLPSPGSV